MILSKCYQGSGNRLGCLSCHDPHVEPPEKEAPGYYREKCLICHTGKSCTLPVDVRRRNLPPDDCSGCHMPKRNVKEIAHTALTNHRILKRPEEPYPDSVFQLTSPELPDLIFLNAVPGEQGLSPAALTPLEAYGQLVTSHSEYRKPYFTLAERFEKTGSDNPRVLEALAERELMPNDAAGWRSAIQFFEKALVSGSTSPADFQQLAILLIRTRRLPEAVEILERGIKLIPYNPELYRLLAEADLALDRNTEAAALLDRAIAIFPEDPVLRQLRKETEDSGGQRR